MTHSVPERKDQPPLLILVITDEENSEMIMNANAENLTTLQNSDINATNIRHIYIHGLNITAQNPRDVKTSAGMKTKG